MHVTLNMDNSDASRYRDLTPGNLYRVLGIEADDYRIVNDEGRPFLYPPELFVVVDPSPPSDWVVTRGDEGEQYAYPPVMGRPGFFEDLFDNDPKAVGAFQQYMARFRDETNGSPAAPVVPRPAKTG